jgi:hypothetical protein
MFIIIQQLMNERFVHSNDLILYILSIYFQPRRKLADWQIWHLRQTYANNRYPTPYEQEQLARQLLLPLSSIRIWFQNYRARSGKKMT